MSSPPPTTTPFVSASLYVGDLSTEVTEALLFERFNAVGPVASVRVCRDAATRRSLGYAYVNFHRVEDAERALDTMNFVSIRNRPCRIMWSHRDPGLRKSGVGNIFVKNLATTIDNKSLYDTFSMFGNILSCKVACGSNSESLGYGFVHYESGENASNAIKRVDGKVIAGKQVSVSRFLPKENRPQRNLFTNIYVKNVPLEWDEAKFTETFTAFGTLTCKLLRTDAEGKSKGFGFVNYSDPNEAQAAITALNGKDWGLGEQKKMVVARAQKKSERERELKAHFRKLKLQRQSQFTGVNLYIKNLGDDVTDEKLRADYSQYGEISSAKVMTKNGKSRGFGFVCFASPEQATRAVTETNGRMVEGKPLYVALAQRKDVRRAQLEAQFAARSSISKVGQPMFQRPPQGVPPMFYQGVPPRMVGQYPMVGQPYGPPSAMMRQPYQLMPAMGGRIPRQRRNPMKPHPVNMAAAQAQQMRGARNAQAQAEQMRLMNMQAQQMSQQMNQQMSQQMSQQRSQQQQQTIPPTPQPVVAHQPPVPLQNKLTLKALVTAPEEQKKQMIGERLFPRIKAKQPSLAGKITGMLLEMDNGELIHLLESQAALNEKINEALQVLHEHEQNA